MSLRASCFRVPRPGDMARLYACVSAATLCLSMASCLLARHLILNCTASMPLGLYWLSRGARPRSADLVAFPVPENVRALVRERRYLPDRAMLLKRIVAEPGDRVCANGTTLSVNDELFGAIASYDSAGRPLPHPAFCGVIPEGEIYVGSHASRSFDSRAFGPIRVTDIRGTVTPLWTLPTSIF